MYLIEEDKLWFAIQTGHTELWQLADYFGVTEEILRFRLRLLLSLTQ